MRRHVLGLAPSELRVSDHVSWLGEGSDDLDRLASDVFTVGAARGEFMLYVVDDPDRTTEKLPPMLATLAADGDLEVAAVDSVYPSGTHIDPVEQMSIFDDVVRGALADGYTGVRVLADNTRLAGGSGADLERWLAWERLTDHCQSTRPLLGVCWFDRDFIPVEYLPSLTSVHSVVGPAPEAQFQLIYDGDVTHLVGAVDNFAAEHFRRCLQAGPAELDGLIDMGETEFIEHRSLIALYHVAGNRREPVRVRNAPGPVRRVWDLLDLPGSRVIFER
ncbi:MAG: MEDS domain-containing protein [Actinobacteria bacterium]|nr:MEDS domain-containing protein [Actinomycetota bacterium]